MFAKFAENWGKNLRKAALVLTALVMLWGGAPTVAEAASGRLTALKVENAEAAYVYVKSTDSVSSLQFVNMETGDVFYKSDFSSSGSFDWSRFEYVDRYDAKIWTFIKPDAGYLLTEMQVDTKDGQLYTLDTLRDRHYDYYLVDDIIELAREQGYIAGFVYSKGATDWNGLNATFSVACTAPELVLDVASEILGSNADSAKEGDTVKFTVTATPQVVYNGEKLNAEIAFKNVGVKLNGRSLDENDTVDYRDNGNGTYTLVITHVVTEQDERAGAVRLDVEASTDFTYDLNLGFSNVIATTTSEATASAYTYVPITEEFTVSYDWSNAPANISLPNSGVAMELPANSSYRVDATYGKGSSVAGWDGKWIFSGWMLDGEVVSGNITVNRNIVLTGNWTFDGDEHTVIFNEGDALGGTFADKIYSLPVHNGVATLDEVPDISDDLYRNYSLTGWRLVSGGGDGWEEDKLYQPEELEGKTVYRDMVFSAEYAVQYRASVYVVLDGHYDSSNHSVDGGEFVRAERVLGPDAELRLHNADTKEEIELVWDEDSEAYVADVENGTYHVLYYNGEEWIEDGANDGQPQQLDIRNEDRSRYLFFYSLGYELRGGMVDEALPTTYYRFGENPVVSEVEPQLEGYRFTGWQLSSNDAIYYGGETLPQIRMPLVLTAQYELDVYAYVNLHLTVDCRTNIPTDVDTNDIRLELTYNDGENYVEVYGVDAKHVDFHDWHNHSVSGTVSALELNNIFADLPMGEEYSLNLFLPNYEVTNKEVDVDWDEEGNIIYTVNATLTYTPGMFPLEWTVKADASVAEALIPQAVDVKVISYNYPVNNKWSPITAHIHGSVDAELSGYTPVEDYYEVPQILPFTVGNSNTAYFRVAAAGFTVTDANGKNVELTASSADGIHFSSNAAPGYKAGAYTAELVVAGGAYPTDGNVTDELAGVYYADGQQGELQLVVYAHPHSVTLDLNYGYENNTLAILRNLFVMPLLRGEVPTREGYTFGGWYTDKACSDGNEYVSGVVLEEDVTLYAKWKPDRTISGTVTIEGFYMQPTLSGDFSMQFIPEGERVTAATVVLQHINENGYAVTVRSETITFGEYSGDAPKATGTFEFAGVPDDGHEHRILVLAHNYDDAYQNEPQSLDATMVADAAAYGNTADDYLVVYGDDLEGVVNAYLTFDPERYDLNWIVDASAVAPAYRPDYAEICVRYYDGANADDPQSWPIISQMVFGDKHIGVTGSFDGDGKLNDSLKVWNTEPDGATQYLYAVSLHGLEDAYYDYSNAAKYFDVAYSNQGAHFVGSTPNVTPTITITPKQFDITYDLQTAETVVGMNYAPAKHTYGVITDLDDAYPFRSGYAFRGWYTDAACTEGNQVQRIPASTAENVTLYAKWVKTQDVVNVKVTLHHNVAGSDDVGTIPEAFTLQLTSATKDSEGNNNGLFSDEPGMSLVVPKDDWYNNTGENDVTDTYELRPAWSGLTSEQAYNANIFMHGYTVTGKQVTSTTDENGVTTYNVAITMQYTPDLLDLEFGVEIHADDRELVELWPVSAEVKVTSWYQRDESDTLKWQTIQQHDETTITIPLNYDGKGSAKYPVWLGTPSYYYRMEIIALTLNDGTVVPMEYHYDPNVNHDHYDSANEIYQAEIVVDGGATPDGSSYAGVYGTKADGEISQVGTVKAVISIHPHNVTLNPQGGTIPEMAAGATLTLDNLIYMPALNSYKPVRDGYTFDGWYMDDDCNNTDEVTGTALVVPAERSVLTENITLYAKWTPISYTITWMRDGGSWIGEAPVTEYTVADLPITMPTADDISRANYLFEGWYEYGKDSNNLITELSNTYGNKTFAAKWALDVWADKEAAGSTAAADSLSGGDGIADKYQAVIYYQVDDGGTAAPTFEVVTVMNGGQPAASGEVVADGATATPNGGYAFDSWDNNYSAVFAAQDGVKSATTGTITFNATGGEQYTFTAYCGVDTNGDGKPDMYQLAVTFRVENGTWADGKTDDKLVWLDRLTNGEAAVNGVAHLAAADIPSGMKPINSHFGSADWSPYAPTTTQAFDHNFTFRYVFAETIYTITYDDAVKYDHGIFNTTDANIASGKSIKLIFDNGNADEIRTINGYTRLERPTRDGYTFIGWQRTLNTDADGVVDADMPQIFTAVWELDVWNDVADSISSGDNIPDKYQVAVMYKAGIGGKVDDAAQVFTLKDGEKYAESGSVTAEGATAIANDKYAFDIWSNPCGATFDNGVANKTTGQLTIPMALGGHSYTFTASFATDTWKDGGDNIGDDSVNSGDGVPDYKQAAFYFRAGANGKLTDGNLVVQVFTLPEPSNGDIKYRGTVTPVNVAYQADAGYAFDYWSKGGDIDIEVNPFVATAMEGGRSITYQAHFAADVNGDNKPDNDQVLVRFAVASGEEARGAVSGSVLQAFDTTDVTPSLDGITVSPAKEYVFDYWTKDGGSTGVNPETAYTFELGEEVTFYAHFAEDAKADTSLKGGSTAFASDGIADKYQYEVVFNIIGCGTHYKENISKTVIYTKSIYFEANEHGRLTQKSKAAPTLGDRIPAVALDAEHKGAWNANVTENTVVSGDAVYNFNIADRSKHVVSYNLMGGNAADSEYSYAAEQLVEGQNHTVKAAPTKAGYEFTGWLSNGTTYQPANVITFVFGMGDLHLVAQWEVETYRISYDLNGGSWVGEFAPVNSYTVEDDEITLPTDDHISYEGHVFEGWYTDAAFTGEPVSVQAAGVTGDKTYYAKWTKDEWNEKTNDLHSSDGIADYKQGVIEFKVDDAAHGSIDANATQVFTLVYTLDDAGNGDYAKAVTPAAVTVTAKTGWALDYWSNTSGDKVDPFKAITLHGKETVTYIANFAEDGGDGVPDKYQQVVTFSIENGTWRKGGSANYTELVTLYDKAGNWAKDGVGRLSSSQLPQGMVANEHYGNGKWTTNAPTLSLEISRSQNTKFNFAFERLVYKVSYFDGSKMASVKVYSGYGIEVSPDFGSWTHEGALHNDRTQLIITEDTTLVDASRNGYTFAGWKCEDLSNTSLATMGLATNVYRFTAQWDRIPYNITYVENGGTDVDNATYTIASEDIILPVITKAGYDFKGWYDNADFNGEPVTKVAKGSIGDKTYYAKWEAITYNINYVLNGDTDNPVSWRDAAAVKYTYTVEDEYTLPLPKRDNYGFAGWYEDATMSGNSVTALQKGSTGNKTYYAKWIADTYTIAYEMNGGSWTQGFTPTTQYTVQSAAITLPTNANISKTGHVFEGWYLTADFSGEVQSELPQGSNGYQRYYAKWAVDVWADKEAAGSTAAADSDSASDGIADYKQAVVKLEAEGGGILNGKTTQVFTLADAGNGVFSGSVKLTAVEIDSNDKIAFDHWADEDSNIVTPFEGQVALNGGETVIYTAHFATDDNDDEIPDYQQIIIHFVAMANGTVSGKTTQATGKLGIDSTHAVTPTLDGVDVAGNTGYTLDYWTLDAGVQPVDPTATVYFHRGTTHTFYAHFAVDDWADADASTADSITVDNLTGGDNIPDYKQAVISFAAAANGAVSGAVDQVFTLDEVSGGYAKSVTPAEITVTPASEYVLDCWKNGEIKVQPIGVATALTGGKTVTYTAYFAADKLVDAAVTDYNGSDLGDGIADKYQNTVTYKLAGKTDADLAKGSWAGGGTADIVKVFTQAAYHTADANGAITQQTKEAPKLGAVPAVVIEKTNGEESHVGYWNAAITAETAVTDDATYTFTIEQKHEHDVVYVLNGGADNAAFAADKVYHGNKFEISSVVPTREHYDFKGWSDGSTTYAAEDTIANVTGDITLTAQWNPTSYSISYDLNDGVWVGGFAPKTGYTIFTRPVALPDEDDISKTGYTFDGWYAEEDFSGSKVTEVDKDASGNKEFWAKWTPVEYSITYEENGGTAVDDGKYTIKSDDITLPDISRVGYSFGGWYAEADFSGAAVTKVAQGSIGNKTYYAKWDVITYNISYDLNDGSWKDGESGKDTYTVVDGTYLLPQPTRADYDFDGWYTDEAFTEGNEVTAIAHGSTGDKTFYAKWIACEYSITYHNADGASGMDGKLESYTVVSLTADYLLPTPAKTGYVFEGWYADEGFAGSVVTTLPKGSSGDKEFYAKWAEDKLADAEANPNDRITTDSLTGGDGIPDYKQAAVQFTAEQPGGSVSGKTLQVFTLAKSGNGYKQYVKPETVTVTANDGYAFLNWVRGSVAADPYVEGGIYLTGGMGKVTYTARFAADASGDGVPDIRQIFVYFLSEDEDEGTVSGSGTTQVFLLPEGADVMDITPSLSNVKAVGKTYSKDNIRFEFDYWTMDDGRTAVDPEDTLYGIAGNTSIYFYAHFDEELIETRGTVVLTKVDAADEDTVLSGVVFELYDDDDDLIGTYTTDEDGEIKVRRLKEGDYYFVEVRPAAGYLLNDEEHEFSIEAAETTKLTVENVRSNVPAGFSTEHYAYIIGYTDRTVQPEANITRAEVATIFFRLLDEETRAEYLTRRNPFSDVAADQWYNTAVSTMAAMGVIVGYEDGTFRPDEQITRAEFAAIAARFDASDYSGEASFSDIYGHWAYREINIAAHNGWILGYTDGTFMPDQAITRAEAMAMVNRVLQRVPENTSDLRRGMIQWIDNQDTGKWYYLTVQEATNSHEYARKSNGYEYWTKLTALPDWTALEQ